MPNPQKRFKEKFFSELQELEVRICVQLNFPIIILILLNQFHKFQGSRELNSVQHFDPFWEGKHMTLIWLLLWLRAWAPSLWGGRGRWLGFYHHLLDALFDHLDKISSTCLHGLVGDLIVDDHLRRVPCVNGTIVVLVLDMARRFKSAREINRILVLLQSKNNSPALKNHKYGTMHTLPYPLLRGESLDCRRHFTLWRQISLQGFQ